jgi:hypothetical protein
MLDPTIRNFQNKVIEAAVKKLGRPLTPKEKGFITGRGGFLALEAVSDYVAFESKDKVEAYLNSNHH